MFSCGQSAGRSWPLLLAVALAALWAAPAQAEDYGLYVCGVQVTDANKDNLSAIPDVKEGTVTYDPATKTLRLKDARIEAAGNNDCIDNGNVDGLTVEVEGQCAMETKNRGIIMHASTTIAGKSGADVRSLVVSAATFGVYVGSHAYNCTCTIRDVDLTVTGRWRGITGTAVEKDPFEEEFIIRSHHLTIKNASVRATGGEGSIYNFSSLTLEGCMVLTPEGAAFDGGAQKKDGEVVTGEAVILPNDHPSVGIGTTAVDAPRREGTYTLTGVRLTAPLDQLPRGVYVVDGQKVVRK